MTTLSWPLGFQSFKNHAVTRLTPSIEGGRDRDRDFVIFRLRVTFE